MTVDTKEILISATIGAIFGILGYYFTRQLYGRL